MSSIMQCQQPPLFGFSCPCPGQYFPSNPVNSFNGLAPDIIGEGEVNSITFPDGTIQYYFLPVRWLSDIYLKRWPSGPFSDNMFCNSYSKPNAGVWIIRNFSNTVSPVYNQYWQRPNFDHLTKPCFSYECNVIPAGFQLKFHNDCWTSTTDLHYFCPYVPPVAPTATMFSTAVQVEPPVQVLQVEPPKETNWPSRNEQHNDPCTSAHCTCIHTVKKAKNDKRKHLKNNRPSSMSVDKSKTSASSSKTSQSSSKTSLEKSKSSKSKKKSKSKSKKKETKKSECDLQSSADSTEVEDKKQKRKDKKTRKATKKSSKSVNEDVLNKVDNDEAGGKKLNEKSKGNCNCDVQRNADKIVTTYNDQASSVKEIERQTQTGCCASCSWSSPDLKGKADDKHWASKRFHCRSKRKAAQSSEKVLGVYEISSSESICTSCNACESSGESVK